MKKLITIGCLIMSALTFAQNNNTNKNNTLTIGGGLNWSTPTYKAKSKISPIPFIFYTHKNFYIQNAKVGYDFTLNDKLTLTPFVDFLGGLDGINSKDMNFGYKGIKDRKGQTEFGSSLMYLPSENTTITNTFYIGNHGSHGEIEGKYDYSISNKLIFTPKVFTNVFSKNLSNYYYGITTQESQDYNNYKLNESYNIDSLQYSYGIGADFNYSFSNYSRITLSVGVTRFSKGINSSPIIESRVNKSVRAIYSYSFIY